MRCTAMACFARMRAAVAAYATGDRAGMEQAMADAQADNPMRFIAALMHQIVHGYDLLDPERLADWRRGLLDHLTREENGHDDDDNK
jgi:hypothetical protein